MKTKTQLQNLAERAEQVPQIKPSIIFKLDQDHDETLPNGDCVIGRVTYDRINAQLEEEY